MKWVKDLKVEAYLRSLHVPFEIETVALASIDLDEGLRRQVRAKKLDDDVVEQYAQAMLAPSAAFPMVVLNKTLRPKHLFPWSGNHRLASAVLARDCATTPEQKNEFKDIECYTTTITDFKLADILPRVINCWESALPVSREERLTHAEYLIRTFAFKVAEVAALVNLKYETLVAHMRTVDSAKELEELGIDTKGQTKAVLLGLASIPNKNLKREAARILKSEHLNYNEKQTIISDIRKADTEGKGMSIAHAWRDTIEARKPKKKSAMTLEVRHKFLQQITGLRRHLEKHQTFGSNQLDRDDGAVLAENWGVIEAIMRRIIREGK